MKIIKLTKESIQDLLEHLLKRSPDNYGEISAAFMKNSARIPGLTLGKRALSWASV